MERSRKILEELKADYVHGASWYFDKVVEAFEALGDFNLEFAQELDEVRPGMASVKNVIEAYQTYISKGYSARAIARALKNLKEKAQERISKLSLEASSIATVSFSSNVLSLAKSSNVKHVYIFITEPNFELDEAVKEFEKFSKVAALPLSSASHFIEYVDAFLTGFDGLYTSGHFVNKSGTYLLSCIAREKGIPVYLIGESFKAYDGFPPPPVKVKWSNLMIPLFENVPIELADYLMTELGVQEKPNSSTIKSVYESFKKLLEEALREGDL